MFNILVIVAMSAALAGQVHKESYFMSYSMVSVFIIAKENDAIQTLIYCNTLVCGHSHSGAAPRLEASLP